MKRILSLQCALVLLVGILSVGSSISAAGYTDTVDAFVYDGYTIPAYDGDVYEEVNGGVPSFDPEQLTQDIYEEYGPLDSLGRVSQCIANIDHTLMPTEQRGSIGAIHPTGWVQHKYDFVSGGYLYNRSHLIGWQLTGENANPNNLMTGTRSFNVAGMLPFENIVASYIRLNDDNNVLYRITPVFRGDDMLAAGVIMEAESVDDMGDSVSFCVFVYNVQPGVSIDYATGDSIATADMTVDISGASVTVADATYTGNPLRPKVTVTLAGKRLTVDRDYSLYYRDNINAGKASVIVSGINTYVGKVTKSFTIKKAEQNPAVSSVKYVYDGKSHYISVRNVKPGSTIRYRTPSTEYSTKRVQRTSVGRTTVYYSITNPNYLSVTGKATITVTPRPVTISSLTGDKASFTLRWKKDTVQTTGYQLQYSTTKSFSSPHSVRIKSSKATVRKVSGLKHSKRYYVHIRRYKVVGDKTYYSTWSPTWSVRTN